MSQNPFQDGTAEPHAAPPVVSECPPHREESPRLGIIHLLGCAVCVAVYFGVPWSLARLAGQTPDPADPSPISPQKLIGYVSMVLSSLSLGGPMLMVARRVRGLRFPRYPGETLLVVLGMLVVVRWATLYPFMSGLTSAESYSLCNALRLAVTALMWLAAAVHTKPQRWRWGFLGASAFTTLALTVEVGPHLMAWALGVSVQTIRTWFSAVPFAAIRAVLGLAFFAIMPAYAVAVAVIDFRNRHVERYPWSHWAGVALAIGAWLVEVLSLANHRP